MYLLWLMRKENQQQQIQYWGTETEVLNEFFDSIFTGRHDFHISHIPEILQNQHMYLTEQTRR